MIGVFGDSYADPWCGNPGGKMIHESWIHHLGESAVPHGSAGTSQLWSYRQFLENHEKYDRVVFILTYAGRFDHAGDKKDWSGKWAITNLGDAERILKEGFWKNKKNYSDNNDWNIPRVKACRDYSIHIRDDIADNLRAQLIKEGILSRRPDTIIIHLGELHRLDNWTYLSPGSWCYHYQKLQMRSLFPDQPHLVERLGMYYREIAVSSHFTPELNQLFASHVRRALAGEGWQDWGVDDMPPILHSRPWDYYYEPLQK
jgi:hypothetical protein